MAGCLSRHAPALKKFDSIARCCKLAKQDDSMQAGFWIKILEKAIFHQRSKMLELEPRCEETTVQCTHVPMKQAKLLSIPTVGSHKK